MSASSPLRIATRGSALALAQANGILAQCQRAFPDRGFVLRIIKTTGDKLQTAALASAQLPKGLFTKEIEEALLREEADLAVHSLKDLPTELPPGLSLGAVTQREDARDVLLYRDFDYALAHADATKPVRQERRAYRPALSALALPHRAVVATSSTRRTAQLCEARPDLQIVPIRGNVGTRLRKLFEPPEFDATVLAAAGLLRLGFRLTSHGRLEGAEVPEGIAATPLSLGEMLPCVGQGAIGIEVRSADAQVQALCQALNHEPTAASVRAERAFLRGMGGGCQLAVAAFAQIESEQIHLRGVSFLHGQPRRGQVTGPSSTPEAVGEALAEQLS